MNTISEKWMDLVTGYEYDGEDSPSQTHLDFYARYFALKALIQEAGGTHEKGEWECVLHQSTSCGFSTWEQTVAEINRVFPRWPEMPTKQVLYHCDPRWHWDDERLERKAKELFKGQFKIAYKGKRLGTKFANAKWREVKGKAMEAVRKDHQHDVDQYEAEEARVSDEHNQKMVKWKVEADRIEGMRAVVENLKGLV